jgi:tripartite-type tricarboxylate transporter receptor subunit TctC
MSCRVTPIGFSRRGVVLAGLLLGGTGVAARAEPFPANRVIRIFVPTGAGSPPDAIGRIVASALSEAEGWRVVVENRPGALQSLAMADVLKQPAEGLFIFPISLGAIATPELMPEKGLRIETDFAPVAKIASGYPVLVVHPSVPATTLPELIALLKSQPDKLNYSAPPFGAPGHLLAEMFRIETGTSFAHVLYSQSHQRTVDLLGGRTQFAFYNTPAVLDFVTSGKLRALAVAGPRRIAALKDVPTVVEAGFPNLVAEDFVGFLVKAGTPEESVQRLNAAVNKVLAIAAVREKFINLGYEAVGGTPTELGQLIASQLAYWTRVVKESGIRLPQ